MTPKFDSITIGLAAACVVAAVVFACTELAAPPAPPAIPGSQRISEVPAAPQVAATAAEPVAAVPAVPVKPVAAPEAVASKAKAPTPIAPGKAGQGKKSAKPATPTLEDVSYQMAAFYAQHVACLRELVDFKFEMDRTAGKIQDFGNVRESGLCGYDYLDPVTGRLPPAEVTLARITSMAH